MSALVVSLDGWDLGHNADRRFRRIVGWIGVPALVLAIVLPFLELSGLQRGGGDTVEERYVSLMPEAEPAQQVEEPAPSPEEQPEPEEAKPVEKPPEKVEPTPPQPKPEPTQAQLQQQAREKAQRSGVLAMADQLAELRDRSLQGLDSSRPLTTDTITAKAGTGASGGSADFAQAAAATSGGIGQTGTADARRSQSGAGLGQRRTTVVDSPVGFGKDKSRPGQDGDKLLAGRTLEEIQLTFDRNKGAFYAIFNRAMRDNPNLGAGKIVVSITIAPSGAVTDCKLVSSTFNDPDLERKVIQRVMLLNFGAKAVPEFTFPNYPINFLPS